MSISLIAPGGIHNLVYNALEVIASFGKSGIAYFDEEGTTAIFVADSNHYGVIILSAGENTSFFEGVPCAIIPPESLPSQVKYHMGEDFIESFHRENTDELPDIADIAHITKISIDPPEDGHPTMTISSTDVDTSDTDAPVDTLDDSALVDTSDDGALDDSALVDTSDDGVSSVVVPPEFLSLPGEKNEFPPCPPLSSPVVASNDSDDSGEVVNQVSSLKGEEVGSFPIFSEDSDSDSEEKSSPIPVETLDIFKDFSSRPLPLAEQGKQEQGEKRQEGEFTSGDVVSSRPSSARYTRSRAQLSPSREEAGKEKENKPGKSGFWGGLSAGKKHSIQIGAVFSVVVVVLALVMGMLTHEEKKEIAPPPVQHAPSAAPVYTHAPVNKPIKGVSVHRLYGSKKPVESICAEGSSSPYEAFTPGNGVWNCIMPFGMSGEAFEVNLGANYYLTGFFIMPGDNSPLSADDKAHKMPIPWYQHGTIDKLTVQFPNGGKQVLEPHSQKTIKKYSFPKILTNKVIIRINKVKLASHPNAYTRRHYDFSCSSMGFIGHIA